MRAYLFAFIFTVLGTASAQARTVCDGSETHPAEQAVCLFKSMVETGLPASTATGMLTAQAQELTLRGLKNSGEYKFTFLGGKEGMWTYLVTVDFASADDFQSLGAAIRMNPDSGVAEIRKVFSNEEIAEIIYGE